MGIQLPAVRFSRIKRELKKGIYPDGDSICNQRLAEQIEYEAGKIDKLWWYIE